MSLTLWSSSISVMEGNCRVHTFSLPNNGYIDLHSFFEIISALSFLEENWVNPCEQIISLFTSST